ncbi:TPR-like protein [Histomonas meleagridis]|uniref:TPR-like protein n=1 Tax=Histomonas meleagridis TaxID=135588 RepID=UPI0035597636|nr:TPR-like protein [Histomonas meleagridis]KAH0798295.1 TPR-like protein [Histomonas meleagridis]
MNQIFSVRFDGEIKEMTFEEICNVISDESKAKELSDYIIENAEDSTVTTIDFLAMALLHTGYEDMFEDVLKTVYSELTKNQKIQIYNILPSHLALFYLQKVARGIDIEENLDRANSHIEEAGSLEPRSPLMLIAKAYSHILKQQHDRKDIEMAKSHFTWISDELDRSIDKKYAQYDLSVLTNIGLGFVYYQLGSYDEAFQIFKKIFLKNRGAIPQIRLALAQCLVAQKKNDDAEAAFSALLHKFPDNPYALIGIGFIELNSLTQEGTLRAVQNVNNVLKQRPDFAPALLLKAEIRFISGQYKKIPPIFKKIISTPGNSKAVQAEAFYHLGRSRHATGKLKGAEEAFLQAIKFNPKHNAALYFLGLFAAANGEPKVALEYLEKSVREYHDVFEVNAALGLVNAELYQKDKNQQQRYQRDAIKYLEAAITCAEASKRPIKNEELLKVYITFGWISLKKLMFDKAEVNFEKAINIYNSIEQVPPDNIFMYHGISKYQREKYNEALEIFRKCNDQTQPLLKYNIGLCYEQLLMFSEAREIYKQLHKDFPSFAEPLLQLASLVVRDTRPNIINKEAKNLLETVVREIDSKNIQAWIQLAEVNARSKQLQEAQSNMQKAQEIAGEGDGSLYATVSIGNYFLEAAQSKDDPIERKKRIDNAKKHFINALKSNHNCVAAANGLAICWLLLGHTKDAKESLFLIKEYRDDSSSSFENLGHAYMTEENYSSALGQFEDANKKFFDKTDVNLLFQSYYASKGKKDFEKCLEISETLCMLRPEIQNHWYLLASSLHKVVLSQSSPRALANVKQLKANTVKKWKGQMTYALNIFKKFRNMQGGANNASLNDKIEPIEEEILPRLNELLKKAKEDEKIKMEQNRKQMEQYSPRKQIPDDIEHP